MYQQKYLKYKQKYLTLKRAKLAGGNIMRGGDNDTGITNPDVDDNTSFVDGSGYGNGFDEQLVGGYGDEGMTNDTQNGPCAFEVVLDTDFTSKSVYVDHVEGVPIKNRLVDCQLINMVDDVMEIRKEMASSQVVFIKLKAKNGSIEYIRMKL